MSRLAVVYEDMLGTQLGAALLEAVVLEARSHELEVVVHGAPGGLAIEAIELGADGLVHLFADPDFDSHALIRAMADHPISSTIGTFSPLEDLVMATRNAARALGLEDEVGTVETGKRADLVMTDGHPDSDLNALERVSLVVQNGAIVVDQR